ncbi:MAG: hypothetical protein U0572_05665 [Phycisphaerales bacterium]
MSFLARQSRQRFPRSFLAQGSCVVGLLSLAACAPLGPRAISFDATKFDNGYAIDPTVRPLLDGDPIVVFAMFHIANVSDQGLDSPPPPYMKGLEPQFEVARERLCSLPPETYARFVEEVARSRAREPDWNGVHYSWGFALGSLGLSADRVFDILDGWEQFEHYSTLGEGLQLSMGEGPFDYLWDLDHGMAGYCDGARERMLESLHAAVPDDVGHPSAR